MLVGRCVSYGEGATYLPLVDVVRQATREHRARRAARPGHGGRADRTRSPNAHGRRSTRRCPRTRPHGPRTGSSKPSPADGRSCSCSKICTGRSRRCSTSLKSSSREPPPSRCSWSRSRGPSSPNGDRTGRSARTVAQSFCSNHWLRTRPSSSLRASRKPGSQTVSEPASSREHRETRSTPSRCSRSSGSADRRARVPTADRRGAAGKPPRPARQSGARRPRKRGRHRARLPAERACRAVAAGGSRDRLANPDGIGACRVHSSSQGNRHDR